MYLKVNINQICHDSERSEEEYGSWSSNYSTTFEGVELVDKREYDAIPLSFDVEKGDIVYVLWAVYSTGDSFGHSTDGSYVILDVFKTFEKAEAAKNIFENVYEKNKKDWDADYRCEYINEVGEKTKGYRPWEGYFESLSGLYIDKAVVSPNDEQYSSKRRK